VFSFNNGVLLRGLYTTKLMKSTLRSKKIFHVKFCTMIRSQDFNLEIKLCCYKFKERLNERPSLRLLIHEMNLSVSTKIIHNGKKIM
jgi:hypothetical protein